MACAVFFYLISVELRQNDAKRFSNFAECCTVDIFLDAQADLIYLKKTKKYNWSKVYHSIFTYHILTMWRWIWVSFLNLIRLQVIQFCWIGVSFVMWPAMAVRSNFGEFCGVTSRAFLPGVSHDNSNSKQTILNKWKFKHSPTTI